MQMPEGIQLPAWRQNLNGGFDPAFLNYLQGD